MVCGSPNFRLHGRLSMPVSAFLLSGVVLGFTANFAKLFLPHIHRTYCLYGVVGTPKHIRR